VAEDHTPGDINGNMMLINASFTAGDFYKETVKGLCAGTTYEFAAWMLNILRQSACGGKGIDPSITFSIENSGGTVLKTYTTGKITAFMSKEAVKIQKEAIALAKKGNELQENSENLDLVDELLDSLQELKDKKAWLICEVYGNRFSIDDIEKSLSDAEIDYEINRIIYGIAGVISKN
jgi:hypothetical protein